MIEDLVRDLTFTKVAVYIFGVSFIYFWVKSFLVDREIRSLGGRAPKVLLYLPYGKSPFLSEVSTQYSPAITTSFPYILYSIFYISYIFLYVLEFFLENRWIVVAGDRRHAITHSLHVIQSLDMHKPHRLSPK